MPVMRRSATIEAPDGRVFAYVDDIRNLARHMSEQGSMPMMGSKLRLEILTDQSTGLGATYSYTGRVLGLAIDVSEAVVRYVPGREKIWRTIGTPRLIIIGSYEMAVLVEPVGENTAKLTITMDYELPRPLVGRVLGYLLARRYAAWCLDSMIEGTVRDMAQAAE